MALAVARFLAPPPAEAAPAAPPAAPTAPTAPPPPAVNAAAIDAAPPDTSFEFDPVKVEVKEEPL